MNYILSPRSDAVPRELFGSKALGHKCAFRPGFANSPANRGIPAGRFIPRDAESRAWRLSQGWLGCPLPDSGGHRVRTDGQSLVEFGAGRGSDTKGAGARNTRPTIQDPTKGRTVDPLHRLGDAAIPGSTAAAVPTTKVSGGARARRTPLADEGRARGGDGNQGNARRSASLLPRSALRRDSQ